MSAQELEKLYQAAAALAHAMGRLRREKLRAALAVKATAHLKQATAMMKAAREMDAGKRLALLTEATACSRVIAEQEALQSSYAADIAALDQLHAAVRAGNVSLEQLGRLGTVEGVEEMLSEEGS